MTKIAKNQDSLSLSDSTATSNIWKNRLSFWDGFFEGFFPDYGGDSIREELSDLLEPRDVFAEDQERIGQDIRVAMGKVSKEIENNHRSKSKKYSSE